MWVLTVIAVGAALTGITLALSLWLLYGNPLHPFWRDDG
jgi:hypothetical protein